MRRSGASFSCRGGRLLNRKGHALAASRAVIKGHVFLDGGFRAYGDVRLLGAEIRGGLNMTIGYGYEPLRALCWIVGFVIFGLSYRGGLLAPSDSNRSGPFCAAVYSVNTFVPLIDLGQRDHWIPRSAPAAHRADSWAGPLGRLLCDAAIVDVLPRSWMPSATFLSFFRWSYILFGWFFTTIFVAGVTGLVRR